MSRCQDITFKRQKLGIPLATASLYLMSFLIKGGSKGGKMQISIYKGQEMGEKNQNRVIKTYMVGQEGLSAL